MPWFFLLFTQAANDHPNSFSLWSHNKLTNEPIQHILKSKRCSFDYSLYGTLYLFRRCCWVPTCLTELNATSAPSPLLHPCRCWGTWTSSPGPQTAALLGIKWQKMSLTLLTPNTMRHWAASSCLWAASRTYWWHTLGRRHLFVVAVS